MEHISPPKTYVGIWIALMLLTMLTAGMSRVDLGPFNTVVALVIATCKGLLVVLFFMHAKYISERTTWVAIVAGFFSAVHPADAQHDRLRQPHIAVRFPLRRSQDRYVAPIVSSVFDRSLRIGDLLRPRRSPLT